MKTLNEKIKEITEKRTSVAIKFAELVSECNLTHDDAANILGISYRRMLSIRGRNNAATTHAATPTRPRAPRPHVPTLEERLAAYTFGVEIECKTRLSHYDLWRAFQEAQITSHDDFSHYNHTNSESSFKIMSDGSVHNTATHFGNEIVSPVLNNFETLQSVCKVLNTTADAKVDTECGLHVHIGAADLSDAAYINVFVNYAKLEAAIDKFMPQSRRENFFCASLRNINFANATTKENTLQCFGRGEYRRDGRRYYRVNACAYHQHKTIEFRQHAGTTNFLKIKNWVNFCKKLVEFSKTTRLDHDITEIAAIPFLSDSEKRFFEHRAEQLA